MVYLIGPYTFSIGDTTDLSDYISGGIVTEVRMPKVLKFVSKLLHCDLYVSFNPNLSLSTCNG